MALEGKDVRNFTLFFDDFHSLGNMTVKRKTYDNKSCRVVAPATQSLHMRDMAQEIIEKRG